MKKIWKKIKGKDRSGSQSPKSGSTRGSVSSLNLSFEVKEKELGKLHKAAWLGDLNKVKQLAKKDTSPLDKENRTPLHLACVRGYREIVQELLDWKAKPNVGDNQLKTPLMRAIEFQHQDCVELLLESGVDIDTADIHGLTPLHLAVRNGNMNIIIMLVKAGASLNIKDKAGYAPLHLAVINKQEDVCHFLLRAKADINIADAGLKTPLIMACQEGSISLVKLLLENKADTSMKDAKGWTADDYAVIQGHHACSQLISDHTIVRRPTPTSTPRSLSQPSSALTTPRNEASFGLPVADAAGEDSDNETISKISGAPGSDSWADSPDVSTGEEVKKGKDGSDLDEEIFDDEKPAVAKISLAKFVSNIHISESDTDGESVQSSTPMRKISVVDNPFNEPQTFESKTSESNEPLVNNKNSWGDSPVTPRRSNSMKGVSFKKDEELSQIHDITATESDEEADFYTTVHKSQTKGLASSTPTKSDLIANSGFNSSVTQQTVDGYNPSLTGQTISLSLEKMRGSTKSAFMEDLGISDVDDISEVSEGGVPPLPSSPPPTAVTIQQKQIDDWDSSISTPRPGILKNKNHFALNESGQSILSVVQHTVNTNMESDDDSSGWDSTETAPTNPEIKPALKALSTKESLSEWDSDIENMANPETSTFSQAVAFTEINNQSNKVQQRSNNTLFPEFDQINANNKITQPINENRNLDKEDENRNCDKDGLDRNDDKDDDSSTSSSDWDSEADELPSGDENPMAYLPTEAPAAHSSPTLKLLMNKVNNVKSEEYEEDSESVSSWEVERKKLKQLKLDEKQKEPAKKNWQLAMAADELENILQLEQETQIHVQREEEEERLRENEEILRRQKPKEEEGYRRQLEEEKYRIQLEEEEKYRRQKQEEEKYSRQKQEEEEKYSRQKQEEEKYSRQKQEEEEKYRRQKQEEERYKKQLEEEEQFRKQKQEEEQYNKQLEEERYRIQLAEEERCQKQEEKERYRKELEEELENRRHRQEEEKLETEREEEQLRLKNIKENNNIDWDEEEMDRQAKLEEAWEMEELNKHEMLRKTVKNFNHQSDNYTSKHLNPMTATTEYSHKQQLLNDLTSPPYKALPVNETKLQESVSLKAYTSAVEEIKQRLQVTSSTPLAVSQFHPFSGDILDDDESQLSDFPGDERYKMPSSYYHGLHRPNDPLDDDALSYTSTEVEDNVYSGPSYWKDRELFCNINLEEPTALLKVQEYVRDARRLFEQEQNKNTVFENKLKVATKEKNEILKKLQNINQERSELEQKNLVLEQEIRSLHLKFSNEQEQRKNAEVLLNKTKEQLDKKEIQFSNELEAKQFAELEMRNHQNELRSLKNSIQELKKEKEELDRQIDHITSACDSLKKINEDQQKLIFQLQHMPKESSSLENSLDSTGRLDKQNPELYALQLEMEQQRRRFKDEVAMLAGENEELASKIDELKNSLKLSEEALDQTTVNYNLHLTSLEKDLTSAHAAIEKEHSAKEKLELEIESMKTRLVSANQEMEKAISVRNEMERDHKRDKEAWSNEMERKVVELKKMKEEVQYLTQQLHTTEARLSAIQNELHLSNTTLTERNSQYQQLKLDQERQTAALKILDLNFKQEKEINAKLQSKIESLQDKLTIQQQETFSFKQQLDLLKLNAGSSQGNETQEKLNSLLASLMADNDRAKVSLEEKNNNLMEQVARFKEELRKTELKSSSMEQDLKRFQEEHNSMVKKLSQSEASLQIIIKVKEQTERERNDLKSELDRLQIKYQESHDRSIESQARISELVDRLEKAESTSILSHQQLVNTSANMQGLVKTKSQLDETMQQLHVENTKLEAELKFEKQRADMLYQDLQDSQKVRSSLEALCANLKSTSAHLEDRLGLGKEFDDSRLDEEIAAKSLYEAEAHERKALYDLEIKSRSKLGLRISDLEKNKHSADAKLEEEISRAKLTDQKLKNLEQQLEFEKEKNQQSQKNVATLKLHLKSAKNKIKETGGLSFSDPQYTDFQKDVFSKETFVSTPREQAHATENLSDVKAELEAKYRKELNRKLSDVNKFLESQSELRDKLDNSRTDLETNLLFDKRKLEEEISNLRIKYEQAVSQRETKEMEAKRFRELYESEMKWRLRVSDQLQLATEKSFNLQSKLSSERHYRSRITGTIGNLNSSVVSSNGFNFSRMNGFQDDELSSKIKAELDRSIAKHLEAAPHDLTKPVIRPIKETERFSSSLAQSSSDYFNILKRKYCV